MKTLYVYEAHDASALSNFVYGPVIRAIAENLLSDISPHLITIAGALCVLLSWVIHTSSDHFRLNNPIVAFFLVCYQLCDALDGIQARKKNQASAFGEFLDHSCDGLSAILIFFVARSALKSSSTESIFFALIYWNHFFVDHLQSSLVQKFCFDVISGPTDGIFILATLFLFKGWYGEAALNFIWSDVTKFTLLSAGAFSLLNKVKILAKHRDRTHVSLLLPIVYSQTTTALCAFRLFCSCRTNYSEGELLFVYCLNMCAAAIAIELICQTIVILKIHFSLPSDLYGDDFLKNVIFLAHVIVIGLYTLHRIDGYC